MLWNAIAHPFLTALLCCAAPVLAFVSLNAKVFTSRQVFGSLLFAVIFGSCLGVAFTYFAVAPVFCAAASLLFFLTLSQHFFSDVMPGVKSRFALSAGIFTLFALSSYLISLAVLNIVILIYIGFGVYDIVKELGKYNKKNKIFDSQGADLEDISGLVKKPNIYVLFLESMHSRSILKDIYDSDDFGLSDYLADKEFLIDENCYSNSSNTSPSFFNIFGMDHYNGSEIGKQFPSNTILKNNGYKVHFYDAPSSILRRLAPFFDYTNLEGRKTFIFGNLAPLLEMVPLLKKAFQLGNSFGEGTDFPGVYHHVAGVLNKHKGPYCCVLRFGAGHSPSIYSLREGSNWRVTWKKRYVALYEKSVSECKKMVDLLTAKDPDSCIIIIGDHGAHYYRWVYDADGRINSIDDQVCPELVAKDAFSVLMAVRYPKARLNIFETPCSHVNILRRIFRMLGAEGRFLSEEKENISNFLGKAPFIVARDGAPLATWERVGGHVAFNEDSPQSRKIQSLVTHMVSMGDFAEATAFLIKTLPISDNRPEHIGLLVWLLFRLGKAAVAEELVRSEMKDHPGDKAVNARYTLLLARALALQDKYDAARGYLDRPFPQNILHLADVFKATERDITLLGQDFSRYELLLKKESKETEISFTYASYLRSIGRSRSAFKDIKISKPDDIFLFALLSMELDRSDEAAELLNRYMQEEAGTSLVHNLLLSGLFEQTGKQREALGHLAKAQSNNPENKIARVALGAFFIRNRVSVPGLEQCRTEAYRTIQEDRELLVANDFFDPDWYLSRYSHLTNGMEPLRHYLLYRDVLFLNPNPHFDYAYYTLKNKDAIDFGISPDRHYLLCSPFELRNPSPIFVTMGYINRFPEVLEAEANPLVHFIRSKGHGKSASERVAA